MAQGANMSTEAFENFYFDVCTMNYPKMARAMIPLQQRMNKTDHVHLKGPGTDLHFSIKGIGALPGRGQTQHSRRRGLLLPCQKFSARRDPIQHADTLRRHEI